jgi:DNA polymerase-1
LALDLLNFRKIPTVDLIGRGKSQISMEHVELAKVATYAAEDADISLRLCDLLEPKIDALPEIKKLCRELEVPLIDVLVEMEFNGVAVDPLILKEQSQVLGERVEALRKAVYTAAGGEFNLDSPKQLQDIFFNRLKLPTGKKTQTGFSTDADELERLAGLHECPRLMLEYRQLTKLKNTYLDNLPEYINAKTHRIHPSFSQLGAD